MDYLSRVPAEVTLLFEIAPSNKGDKVAFVRVHGKILDGWSDLRSSVLQHTGLNTYPESARLGLLNAQQPEEFADIGASDVSGGVAWASDDSLLAYVSGKLHLGDDRRRIRVYDVANQSSEEVYVSSDWFVRRLAFSPDSKSLAFVENYNQDYLTLLDIETRRTTTLASGVSSHYVCWAVDGKSIFCVRNGLEVWRLGVDGKTKDLLFKGKDFDENYPYFLVPSPDGNHLGFGYAGALHVLDLATNQVEKLFECHHYFLTFDWSDEGICYLDQVGEEDVNEARVMIYDPSGRTNEEVVVGPFAHVAWLRKGVLILRKENEQLWELELQDKRMNRLFPPTAK
ncbi:MAG: hypothetical protein AAGA92_08980 [Planctomycetota bacterium]